MKKLLLFIATFLLSVCLFSCSESEAYTFCLHTGNTENYISSYSYTREEYIQNGVPEPYRVGYAFQGWYIDPYYNQLFTDDILDIEGYTHIELFAKYELAKYSVNIYDVIEPKTEEKEPTYEKLSTTFFYYDSNINLYTPEKEGFVFAGFYEDDAFTKPLSYTEMPPYNLDLFVKWATPDDPVCTYYFHTGTAEMITSRTIAYKDLSAQTLPTPTLTGYNFDGWYTDAALTEKFDIENADTTVSAMELFAKFSIATYNVNVISDGEIIATIPTVYGDTILLTEPEDEARLFAGFFFDEEFLHSFDLTTMPAHDVNVYVKWADSFSVAVSTNMPDALTLSGGELTQTVTKQTAFAPIFAEAKLGYKYAGYSINGVLYEGETISLPNITENSEIVILAEYATLELPIVNIDTDGALINSRENYTDMSFSITNMGEEGEELDGVTGGIRIRGNSTSGYPKKPYRIKFDKKQSLFGLEKAKSWVLLAEYRDPSVLRNYSAFSLAEDGNFRFVPSPHTVNVYLNGEYAGIYTLCEHVQENPGRIDIEKDITADMSDLFDYNFFISMDRKVLEDPGCVEGLNYFYLPEYQKYFEIKYPEKDDFTSDEQFESFFNQMKDYCLELCRMFSERDVDAIKATVNIDTLIDFTIIDQIMGENDHGSCSFNMFYTSTSGDSKVDGKLSFGPIWDYDSSLHIPWKGAPNDEHFETSDRISYTNFFFSAVANIPEFYEMLKDRYNTHYKAVLENYIPTIDEMVSDMKVSLDLNAKRWYGAYSLDMTKKNIDLLKAFLSRRLTVLNEAWKITE